MRKINCKTLFAFTTLLTGTVWMLFWIGCGNVEVLEESGDKPLEEVVETTGSIKGTVAPLSIDAGVIVVKEGEQLKFVMSDAQGEYTISDLPAGEYNLEVTAPFHFIDISLKRVQVIPGQTTLAEKVTLRSWADAAAIFTGSVLDAETGKPIEKADIRIECATSVCSPLFATTEDDGSFKKDIWPDLESNIIISKIGYKTGNVRVKPLGPKGKEHLEFKLEPKD